MVSLVQQMLMDRRNRPREDFLSRYLAEIEIKADGLSAEEAVTQIVLLIVGRDRNDTLRGSCPRISADAAPEPMGCDMPKSRARSACRSGGVAF